MTECVGVYDWTDGWAMNKYSSDAKTMTTDFV